MLLYASRPTWLHGTLRSEKGSNQLSIKEIQFTVRKEIGFKI